VPATHVKQNLLHPTSSGRFEGSGRWARPNPRRLARREEGETDHEKSSLHATHLTIRHSDGGTPLLKRRLQFRLEPAFFFAHPQVETLPTMPGRPARLLLRNMRKGHAFRVPHSFHLRSQQTKRLTATPESVVARDAPLVNSRACRAVRFPLARPECFAHRACGRAACAHRRERTLPRSAFGAAPHGGSPHRKYCGRDRSCVAQPRLSETTQWHDCVTLRRWPCRHRDRDVCTVTAGCDCCAVAAQRLDWA